MSLAAATRRLLGGALGALCALSLGTGATCEQQDFAAIEEVLEVSASSGQTSSTLSEPLQHDRITRHALDYRVTNTADAPVEVVVEATSLVNGARRAQGRAVVRLDGGSTRRGRITDLQLEVGNGLDLGLQCCAASQCFFNEVLCPASDGEGRVTATAEVCLEGCDRIAACAPDCSASCGESCAGAEDVAACVAACEPECVTRCERATVVCAANCLASYRGCADLSANALVQVPCALCGGSGLCEPSELGCAPTRSAQDPWNCLNFPVACMTGCTDDANFDPADRAGRFACLESCIVVHQIACELSLNAIRDPSVKAPCCYSDACEARLEAVIKVDSVECYVDSDCGTGRQCNARGICENQIHEEQAGCSVLPLGRRAALPRSAAWLAGCLLVLLCGVRTWRRRGRLRAARRWLSLGAGLGVLLTLVAWPGQADAEPRRFRLTRSSFVLGVSSGSFVVGALGGATGAGLGLSAQQTIASGYFGGSVRIGATIYPSEAPGLVFDQGLQSYYVAAGPRFVFPTLDELELYLYVQPEYVLQGLQSNALVELSGGSNMQHGPSGQVGLQLALDPLALELSGAFGWVWPADAGQLTVTLGVGFTGIL